MKKKVNKKRTPICSLYSKYSSLEFNPLAISGKHDCPPVTGPKELVDQHQIEDLIAHHDIDLEINGLNYTCGFDQKVGMDIFHRPYQAKNCHIKTETRVNEDLKEGLAIFTELNSAINDMDDLAKTFEFAKTVVKFSKHLGPFLGVGAVFSIVDFFSGSSTESKTVKLIIEQFDQMHERFDRIKEKIDKLEENIITQTQTIQINLCLSDLKGPIDTLHYYLQDKSNSGMWSDELKAYYQQNSFKDKIIKLIDFLLGKDLLFAGENDWILLVYRSSYGSYRTMAQMKMVIEARIINAVTVYIAGCQLKENNNTFCDIKANTLFREPFLELTKKFDTKLTKCLDYYTENIQTFLSDELEKTKKEETFLEFARRKAF